MQDWNSRTKLLIGDEKLSELEKAHILVVGLGGVGAYAAELICRAGVGEMTIVDADVVEPTNKNRQLPALDSNMGIPKAEIMEKRLKDINPNIKLTVIKEFMKDDKITSLLNSNKYTYVVDAIDTLSPKVFLMYNTLELGIPIVSAMGAGGKSDPSLVKISDISKSYNCKLARIVRKKLHRLGVSKGIKVVFSPEEVPSHAIVEESSMNKNSNVGTISYMPAVFGCFMASVVINDLIHK